ncbi:dsRBD fold-containing protein [Streptomyces sp. NPDC015127]|uniref:dsRBD fold-containing protein n=1 Tax=Streptomyces sp. NPDC015127 TaxID=3364939 RepID=UPI0037029CEF
MTRTLEWKVGIVLVEEDGTTRARAVLDTGTTTITGHGTAHRNPQDVDVPEIGDELAAARALHSLTRQLMKAADHDLEAVGAGNGTPPGEGYGWPYTTP